MRKRVICAHKQDLFDADELAGMAVCYIFTSLMHYGSFYSPFSNAVRRSEILPQKPRWAKLNQ